jgi:hypothetical protein
VRKGQQLNQNKQTEVYLLSENKTFTLRIINTSSLTFTTLSTLPDAIVYSNISGSKEEKVFKLLTEQTFLFITKEKHWQEKKCPVKITAWSRPLEHWDLNFEFQELHHKGKRPLGRPRCRWVDNIKMDLREIGWDGMNWIDLA